MRSDLAPVLLHLLILLAGLGLLRAAGVVPRVWSMRALAAGGLAYLCGVAAALTLSILLLVLGGPFNLVTFTAICLVLASPLLIDVRSITSVWGAAPRWLARPRESWRAASWERRLVLMTMAVFAISAVVGILTLSGQPIDREAGYDTWNLWMRKANLMFFGSHLPLAEFKSQAEGYIQAYYPLGYPLLLAAHMRSMGLYETSTVHVVVWVLLVAFVWAGAFLASQVTRPLVWAAILPGTVFLVYSQASSGYADIPVAIFLGLAVLATGIWLEHRRRADLWVACLLLAGAVQIKNEGFTGAIIIMVVAGCYLLRADDRAARIRELAVGAVGVVLLAILPWRLWLAANHIGGDHSLGKTFDPHYLVEHFKRVWPSLKALEAQITSQMGTSALIVIALALALVRLRGRARSPLSGFYLAVGLLYFLSLLAAYWTSPFDEQGLPFYIETSVFRIVPGGLGFICVGAILHLSNVASALTSQEPDDSSRASPRQPPTS
jgi:hypothetical protein